MDGYAVCAEDVSTATHATPIALRVVGRIAAGENHSGGINRGECVRLFTGSMIPAGANAVVMQEDTRLDPARPDVILVCDSVKPGESLRRRGEDVSRGAQLAEAGERLLPGRMALLAATGVEQVSVARQPKVGLLATGSELREAGHALSPGAIYESNRAALAPLIARAGGVPEVLPLVSDSLSVTKTALENALATCDMVVTCGGVSVGEMDFVKAAFEQLGGAMEFWKVAVRPGKPFVFGRHGKKFLFGLPGNPVSAFVTFVLLVRPALLQWQGAKEIQLPSHSGQLAEPLVNRGDRRHFLRVRFNANGSVYSAGQQASHALMSLASANGLVDVPPETTLAAGTAVKVLCWD
jgi:molybdopterin molybdotransferase